MELTVCAVAFQLLMVIAFLIILRMFPLSHRLIYFITLAMLIPDVVISQKEIILADHGNFGELDILYAVSLSLALLALIVGKIFLCKPKVRDGCEYEVEEGVYSYMQPPTGMQLVWRNLKLISKPFPIALLITILVGEMTIIASPLIYGWFIPLFGLGFCSAFRIQGLSGDKTMTP